MGAETMRCTTKSLVLPGLDRKRPSVKRIQSIDAFIKVIIDRRIDAHVARTQPGQIMDFAVKNNECFIVDRNGEPSVVIMSVRDFIRTVAPPPDWLEKAWAGAKRRGLDALTVDDINHEIDAHRRSSVGPPSAT